MMRQLQIEKGVEDFEKGNMRLIHCSFPGTVEEVDFNRCVLQLYMERKQEDETHSDQECQPDGCGWNNHPHQRHYGCRD